MQHLPGRIGDLWTGFSPPYGLFPKPPRAPALLGRNDALTGLPTREPFLASLPRGSAQGGAGVLGVIRFADYDNLAAFDEGRAERALAAFGRRLKAAAPAGRPLGRIDRDCFAVWLAGLDRDQAGRQLQAIAAELSQELGDGELRISPDVGLGAALFPADAAEPAMLLTRACAAVRAAGPSGARALAFFSSEASEAARERFQLEQALRQALPRRQLLLHYQPVFDAEAGRVAGAEALLRWRHPELGSVPPGKFVPVLERTGLMEEVGLWALDEACRQARAWEEAGVAGLKLSVNLSARQCRDPGFAAVILKTVERHGLRPQTLELELTETAAMEDGERTRALLGELRSLGVGVALDDFGSGYSSLSYLKNLPLSKLKIDREFVTEVDRRRDSRAICAALIELARGLGIAVLAEGVERPEEVALLRELGCTLFQGFYFARPMPGAEVPAAVADLRTLARRSAAA